MRRKYTKHEKPKISPRMDLGNFARVIDELGPLTGKVGSPESCMEGCIVVCFDGSSRCPSRVAKYCAGNRKYVAGEKQAPELQ